IYASGDSKEFEGSEVKLSGSLQELLGKVDIVVDATPEGIGEKNKSMYEKAGVKAIWQVGKTTQYRIFHSMLMRITIQLSERDMQE
ncbi:Glyceraldehyde 3-phosphate dehydrogenase, partial [mine drainage metagenome]